MGFPEKVRPVVWLVSGSSNEIFLAAYPDKQCKFLYYLEVIVMGNQINLFLEHTKSIILN